jgi:hypothetical protein
LKECPLCPRKRTLELGLVKFSATTPAASLIFAAIRRASLCITIKLSPAHLIAQTSLSDAPYKPIAAAMSAPKFKIGDTVFLEGSLNVPSGAYVVIRLLPEQNGEFGYQNKECPGAA